MGEAREASRERFLIAAEQLFVEHGYRGTTIRAICAQAGTSLALLNRNWPSKEALFAEMLKRHFDPLHALQDARLDELAQQERPDIAHVLTAFFKPAFRAIGSTRSQRASIYSRALIDPSREIKQIVAALIGPTRARLIDLVGKALPGLDRNAMFIAMNLVFGAYVYPQAFGHQLANAMNIDDTAFDWEAGSAAVVALLCRSLGEGTSAG